MLGFFMTELVLVCRPKNVTAYFDEVFILNFLVLSD